MQFLSGASNRLLAVETFCIQSWRDSARSLLLLSYCEILEHSTDSGQGSSREGNQLLTCKQSHEDGEISSFVSFLTWKSPTSERHVLVACVYTIWNYHNPLHLRRESVYSSLAQGRVAREELFTTCKNDKRVGNDTFLSHQLLWGALDSKHHILTDGCMVDTDRDNVSCNSGWREQTHFRWSVRS